MHVMRDPARSTAALRLLTVPLVVVGLVFVARVGMAASPPQSQQSQWTRIAEPEEWRLANPRPAAVARGSTLYIDGTAQHPNGIGRVLINGVRASLSVDPAGGTRFRGYARSDPAYGDSVEIAIEPRGGTPVVHRYPLAVSDSRGVVSSTTAGRRSRAQRWAVIIGVGEYQDRAIPPLQFASRDAESFAEFLRSERAGGTGYHPNNVKVLLNKDATVKNVRTALFTFLRGVTEDDVVVIYFAGHGLPDPDRMDDLYLLTHDSEIANLPGTALPMKELQDAIRRTYAHDIIVITDACHSGGVAGGPTRRSLETNEINQRFLQDLEASSGTIVAFSASQVRQTSLEGPQWGGGHGIFTHYMLEALRGAADADSNSIVSLGEMMEWVRDTVRRETRNSQIPAISATSYDFAWPVSIVPSTEVARSSGPAGSAGTLLVSTGEVAPARPTIASLAILPSAVILDPGGSARLQPVARDIEQRELAAAGALWSSSDPRVVAVDSVNGIIRATGEGAAMIRVTVEGLTAEIPVSIRPRSVIAEAPVTGTASNAAPNAAPNAASSSFEALSAGGTRTCARQSAALLCWGGGAAEPSSVPHARSLGSVSVGRSHACGLDDGRAFCWGSNASGQLGTGSTVPQPSPTVIDGLPPLKQIAAGGDHTCALSDSGTAYCWGENGAGQLGDGSTRDRQEPAPVRTRIIFASLAAGTNHTCGLASDGKLYCWGDGFSGALGTGRKQNEKEPVSIADELTFAALALGETHSCALTGDGKAYCWGENRVGQLGDGSTWDRTTPTAVKQPAPFAEIVVGKSHSCARDTDGSVFCWGAGGAGQLGDITPQSNRNAPVRVFADRRFDALAAGELHTCALGSATVTCWGASANGQLGTFGAAKPGTSR